VTDQHPQHVFLVGAPRSGTTWLQLLLSQHPAFVTSQETALFSSYLSEFRARWTFETSSRESEAFSGLSTVLSEAAFKELCRSMADRVFAEIRKARPEAEVILEKTPNHVFEADFILSLYPDAYFVHLVRDPRSVVASLRATSRSWGAHWAARGTVANARQWRASVESGRNIAAGTQRYRQIRYEDLMADGAGQLQQLFEWLGRPVDIDFCADAVESCRIEKLREGRSGAAQDQSPRVKPEGFFRAAKAQGWREELSTTQIGIIERVAGDLMAEFGY